MANLKCCGPSYGDSGNAVRNTIVLGVALSISFILLLVAGIVDGNWLREFGNYYCGPHPFQYQLPKL